MARFVYALLFTRVDILYKDSQPLMVVKLGRWNCNFSLINLYVPGVLYYKDSANCLSFAFHFGRFFISCMLIKVRTASRISSIFYVFWCNNYFWNFRYQSFNFHSMSDFLILMKSFDFIYYYKLLYGKSTIFLRSRN